ncbi:MAG: glycosyltransferase family 2 protein, partial [Ketobacter sp.]|nr:glycosyltransferase family 2 protein [Ketobacter sp.]
AYPPQSAFEVVLVDNASADGSADMVREQFPQVRLVESPENVGFAQGNNLAVPLCQGEYVLLLNPDTIVKPGAFDALVEFLDENPEAGSAGSMLLNPDETLQPSCHPAPRLTRELWRLFHLDVVKPYGRYHMHTWSLDTPREVDVVQGASMLVRKEILDRIGFLDGDYFMYSEEVDLCFRLQQAGWKLYWVPQSKVIHYGGQSTKQVATDMFMQLYLGKLKYFRKHYGGGAGIVYKLILAAASLFRLLLTPLAWLQ